VAQVTVQDGSGNSATAQLSISVFGATWKMKLSFPGYNQAETLTNFPALVVLGPWLATNGFAYSQVASPNGWDLLFLDATGTQELNYEIESWNSNGNSYVWVQLPQLTTSTFIWACWGDTNRAGVPAPYLTNGAVWANGYVGVWPGRLPTLTVLAAAMSVAAPPRCPAGLTRARSRRGSKRMRRPRLLRAKRLWVMATTRPASVSGCG